MDKLLTNKLGVVGVGKMGIAIIRSLNKLKKEANLEIHVHDVDPEKLESVSNFSSISIHHSPYELLNENYPVLICTKPGEVSDVIRNIPNERLIISIAAGITIGYIDSLRKKNGPTVRVMPNISFQVKKGYSVLCPNSYCSKEEKEFVLELFSQGGKVRTINNEKMLDAITAISGSGPAFVFSFMQSLEDSGVLLGLSRKVSREIAIETVLGAVTLSNKNESIAPQDLTHNVTSPGGTTIHGLEALQKYRFHTAIVEAVKAAHNTSKNINS